MNPAKLLRWLLGRGWCQYHRLLLTKARARQGYVLILGHMRSGSTLLAHLLMNHPQILGGGERNKILNGEADLFDLCLQLYREHRLLWRTFPYVLDQINHSRFTPDPNLLNDPRVQVLFLIRRPGPSTASMVRTFQPIYGNWPIERAIETYERRLQSLQAYANQMTQPWFFTTYEDLVGDSQQTLGNISRFLKVEPELSDNYRIWSFTGKRGDPSPRIGSGTILPSRSEDREELLTGASRERLEALFQNTCRLLSGD